MKAKNLNIRVVVVGGGTGNSTVLSGLSKYVGDGLTAVVNTFDDGGATGKLRSYYDTLPAVGDLRQCLRALSQAPPDERELFNSRFEAGNKVEGDIDLHGQTMGNLIIALAMQKYGNFSTALGLVGRMYNINGQVLPASNDNRHLEFRLPDGNVIYGEHNAEETQLPSMKGAVVGFNKEPTTISDEAKAAIEAAELVVLAPGDLYTSLAPVLAVGGMKHALQKAGKVIMIANLMNRDRHTVDFTVVDYARELERIIGMPEGEQLIDRIIFNTQMPGSKALEEQARLGSFPVLANKEMLRAAGYDSVGKDMLSREDIVLDPNDAIANLRTLIRHDPDLVARAIMAEYFR